MGARIFLVEDDRSLTEVVASRLRRAGYQVDHESDGRRAVERFPHLGSELVLLDVILPSLTGLQVCEQIRRISQVPIIMLTARTDASDVVAGLEAGADDYVKKPFDASELDARIAAVLRRAERGEGEELSAGDIRIDPRSHTVHKAGVELRLSATEFRLLAELARDAGRVFSRKDLLSRIWDYDYLGDSRLVDMAIKRLRDKVEDDPRSPRLIRTVRGVGYRLEPEPDQVAS